MKWAIFVMGPRGDGLCWKDDMAGTKAIFDSKEEAEEHLQDYSSEVSVYYVIPWSEE